MLSPERFIKLLGAEYALMRNAGILKRFHLASIFIVIILLLTGVSIFYAIDLLFSAIVIEITLTVFFCLLFGCIYIFLLNTFAKESRVIKKLLNLSDIIRIGFIGFIGFLIAQPLTVLVYTGPLETNVAAYKKQLFALHTGKIADLTKKELANMHTQYHYYSNQKNKFGTVMYDDQLRKIDHTINEIQSSTDALNKAAYQTIYTNNFFLYRVKKAAQRYPSSWLITGLVMIIFLLPGYLVYTISSGDEYYLLKKTREKELIMKSYNWFVHRYEELFEHRISIFSRYSDPPFNTSRKQPPVPETMNMFVQKYIEPAPEN